MSKTPRETQPQKVAQQMNPQLRVVTRQPMTELWRDDGLRTTQREAALSTEEVASLMRAGPVQFVVSTIGGLLQWVPLEDRFEFWKGDAKAHIAEPSQRVRLEDFPGEYFYRASRWSGDSWTIILLEIHH